MAPVFSDPLGVDEIWLDVSGRLCQLVQWLYGATVEMDSRIEGYRVVSLTKATAIVACEAAPTGGWERVRLDLDPVGRITRVSWSHWDPARERAWRCLVSIETGPSLEAQRPE